MTLEERLQMQLGVMLFQIQVMQSQLEEKDKEIAVLKKNGHDDKAYAPPPPPDDTRGVTKQA